MLTENELVLDHKPPKVAEITEFNSYRDNGGRLPERFFNKAQQALKEQDAPDQQYGEPIHERQASNYVRRLDFELTPKQIFLYSFLMESQIAVSLSLSDQRVVAEALLMTRDFEKYAKFTSAYPNIFKKTH